MKTTTIKPGPPSTDSHRVLLKIAHLLFAALMLTSGTFAQTSTKPAQLSAGQQSRNRLKQIYTSQIGVREKPQNSGPQVEKYLRYVKLPKGNPWCAAFVCWSLGEAGVANPRSGWSPDLFGAKRVIWEKSSSPIAHSPRQTDVFGLYFPEKRRIAHVGFIDSWDGTWVITVEGNTNDSGAREGDGVYRKRRLVKTLYQVARYID